MNVMFRNLCDSAVHGEIVLARGNQEIHLCDQAMPIDVIMVKQRAAWRFADADPFEPIDPGPGAKLLREHVRIFDRRLNALDGGEDFDQPGVMEKERGVGSMAGTRAVLMKLSVCLWRAQAAADVEPRQGPHPIDAFRIPPWPVIRRL